MQALIQQVGDLNRTKTLEHVNDITEENINAMKDPELARAIVNAHPSLLILFDKTIRNDKTLISDLITAFKEKVQQLTLERPKFKAAPNKKQINLRSFTIKITEAILDINALFFFSGDDVRSDDKLARLTSGIIIDLYKQYLDIDQKEPLQQTPNAAPATANEEQALSKSIAEISKRLHEIDSKKLKSNWSRPRPNLPKKTRDLFISILELITSSSIDELPDEIMDKIPPIFRIRIPIKQMSSEKYQSANKELLNKFLSIDPFSLFLFMNDEWRKDQDNLRCLIFETFNHFSIPREYAMSILKYFSPELYNDYDFISSIIKQEAYIYDCLESKSKWRKHTGLYQIAITSSAKQGNAEMLRYLIHDIKVPPIVKSNSSVEFFVEVFKIDPYVSGCVLYGWYEIPQIIDRLTEEHYNIIYEKTLAKLEEVEKYDRLNSLFYQGKRIFHDIPIGYIDPESHWPSSFYVPDQIFDKLKNFKVLKNKYKILEHRVNHYIAQRIRILSNMKVNKAMEMAAAGYYSSKEQKNELHLLAENVFSLLLFLSKDLLVQDTKTPNADNKCPAATFGYHSIFSEYLTVKDVETLKRVCTWKIPGTQNTSQSLST